MDTSRDTLYLNMLLKRIEVCKTYKPKFGLAGKEIGLSLERFQVLYGSDVFYNWFGLNHPLVYAAHKAAGGMTSVYRQIGTGVEALIRQILRDEFQLTPEQVKWTYELKSGAGRKQVLSLDGRLALVDIQIHEKQRLLGDWLQQAARKLDVTVPLNGVVFEIRQGYKSRDSKRQNADINNAAVAYSQGYLPAVIVLSGQIDRVVVERYERNKWLVLRGNTNDDTLISTYRFMSEIVGYNLEAFFQRNASQLKQVIVQTLESLLDADSDE